MIYVSVQDKQGSSEYFIIYGGKVEAGKAYESLLADLDLRFVVIFIWA
jgi:hypothetical protein